MINYIGRINIEMDQCLRRKAALIQIVQSLMNGREFSDVVSTMGILRDSITLLIQYMSLGWISYHHTRSTLRRLVVIVG